MSGREAPGRSRAVVALGGAVVLFGAACAHAQMFSGLAGSTAMTNLMFSNVRQQSLLNLAHKRRAPSAAAAAAATAAAAVPTGYAPSPASLQTAERAFVARLRATNPVAAAQAQTAMRQDDVGRVYEALLAGTGLRRGDVADALTAYTVLGWMIVNGRTQPPPRARIAAARAATAAAVAGNPAIASEAARVQSGEELAVLFVVLHAGWQSAEREGTLSAYANGVAAMFETGFGQDLRGLEPTDRGFARGG